MKSQDRKSLKPHTAPKNFCPECGGRLVVDDRSNQGETVRIGVCSSEDCDYFCWKVLDFGPEEKRNCWTLADWAIKESLNVLRDGGSASRFAPLRSLFEGVIPSAQ